MANNKIKAKDCNVFQDMGKCGQGKINLYTDTLAYFYDDFSVTRTQVPFGVRHVFVPENY